MKKKKLAIASLLMALLMPLAVYAEGDDALSTDGEVPVETYADTDAPAEVTPIEWPDAADWTVSCSKDATALDENYTSEVTLALPAEQEQLATEICFVLDKSSYSSTKEKALSLLSDLKKSAAESGAKITVDIVGFNNQAQDCGTFDLSTQYDEIEKAFNSDIHDGTNMHAGLLLAKEKLAADSSIPNSRKYMLLVSDGGTYLYCKGGDYKTPYSRSFEEFEHANDAGMGYGGHGTEYYHDPSAQPGNVHRPTTSTPADWDLYFADVKKRNEVSNGDSYDFLWKYYEEDWDKNPDKAKETYVQADYNNAKSASNLDMALLYAAGTYKELASEYHCYSISVKSLVSYGGSVAFMGYLNGGAEANFDEIQNEIAYAVGAGSYVEDVIGDKFTLDVDSLSVSVDGKALTKESNGANSWKFGDADKDDRFTVAYNAETKMLTWNINENVTNFARVRLSYKVKLSNPETTPGSYSAFTNQWATLHPKDSTGAAGREVEFPNPKVSYNIYALNYNANGGNGAPNSEVNCTGKFTVSDIVPTRDGYTFAGWNTTADGSGTSYAAGSAVELGNESPALTLYAQWFGPATVTVHFDLCGPDLCKRRQGERACRAQRGRLGLRRLVYRSRLPVPLQL